MDAWDYDSHIRLYRDYWQCSYRLLPYDKQACNYCPHQMKCKGYSSGCQ